MSIKTESLIQEFENFLGKKPYFTTNQLIEIGLFGSASAANAAIKRGSLPTIKISPKRTVIPRSAVLEYFRNNLTAGSVQMG